MNLSLPGVAEVQEKWNSEAFELFMLQLIERMQINLRESDTLAYFGPGRFVLMFEDTTPVGASVVAEKVLREIQKPFLVAVSGQKLPELHLQGNIGAVVYPEHGLSAEVLMLNAEDALKRSQALGDGRIVFWGGAGS